MTAKKKPPVVKTVAMELEELRDRVAMLEDIIGIGEQMNARLRVTFDIQPNVANVLGMLLNRQIVSKGALYDMLYGHRPECDQPTWKSIDVIIHKLRHKLRQHGIEFSVIVGEGYVMKPSYKQRVRDLIGSHERGEVLLSTSLPRVVADFPVAHVYPQQDPA